MKKLLLALTATLLALMPARAGDTVELLPGKITGSITLSSETIQSGQIYANATDGSSSASTSFTGSTYSLVVPAGKSWRLSFYCYTQVATGASSYLYVNPPDAIGPVGADQTVTHNVAITTARIAADVQVANGTLSAIPSLQSSGNSGGSSNITSFSASSSNQAYVLSLPSSNVSVYGTATVKSTTHQTSTQTLSNKTVNVTAAGATATWSLDAAFSAGSIAGSVNLTGAASPANSYVYLYAPNGSYVGNKTLPGNGTFQFENLMAGSHGIQAYAYFNAAQLYLYRSAPVTAGEVTTVDFASTVAVAQTSLNLTGFLTPAKINSASLSANWTPPNPNPNNFSNSAYSSLNSSGGFTTYLVPGEWSFSNVNVSGYDGSTPGFQYYYSLGLYDYQRANLGVTFAAGDTKTLPAFNINTTQTELTFDVVEPSGATSETLISDARVSGYVTTYVTGANGSQTAQYQLSFNSSTYTNTPQARPRVRIVGMPGTYTVQTYGTVSGSNVSFGNFTLELKAPLPTPVGTDVTVAAGTGVTLVFDNVTTAGVSTSSQLPVGPALPAGYSILTNSGAKVYYNISTTATFSGYVDVTVAYAADAVPAALEPRLKLFYYDNATQKWIDVTVGIDQVNNQITGTAPALSLFAVGVAHDPVLGSVTVPVDALKATALSFSALFTDADSNDIHTATWTWGDGTTSTGTITAATGTVSGTHTYAHAGNYSGSLALTDATGTTVTKTFSVTVGGGDSTAPVISLSGNVTAEATSAAGAVVTFAVTATDDTDGSVAVTTAPASGSVFALGTTTVTATARDAAGNVATKTFSVTVADTTAPVITAQAVVTAEATSTAGAVVTFAPTATDLAGAVTVTTSLASGSTFPVGTTTVTTTATDTAGNTATATFVVTVTDTTKPVLSEPAAVTAEATSAAGATVTFAATATDNVGATVTYNKAPGSVFPVGDTTVTSTATEAAGNTVTATFVVSVTDTTKPVIAPLANLTLEATSPAGATATFAATVTDAVGATATYSRASGSTFPLGTTTVTINATDAAGNVAIARTFTVTVRDTTAPVFSSLSASTGSLWPANHKMVAITLTAATSDLAGAVTTKIVSVTSSEPDNGLGDGDTANDTEITGAMTLNLRAERSGTGNGRTYTITVEAKDAAGNITRRTTTVSVPKNQSGK
jgi:hypothetical protein